jgi:hypothetical protein
MRGRRPSGLCLHSLEFRLARRPASLAYQSSNLASTVPYPARRGLASTASARHRPQSTRESGTARALAAPPALRCEAGRDSQPDPTVKKNSNPIGSGWGFRARLLSLPFASRFTSPLRFECLSSVAGLAPFPIVGLPACPRFRHSQLSPCLTSTVNF